MKTVRFRNHSSTVIVSIPNANELTFLVYVIKYTLIFNRVAEQSANAVVSEGPLTI
jgi:hypothetical protein